MNILCQCDCIVASAATCNVMSGGFTNTNYCGQMLSTGVGANGPLNIPICG